MTDTAIEPQTMKALTLWQPWASLVALGVKTIETRSWATRYRGPLAIHAATRKPKEYEQVGQYVVHEMSNGSWAAFLHDEDDIGPGLRLPLGAIVATCTLTACAPIGGPYDFRTGLVEGDEGDWPNQPVVVRQPPVLGLPEALILDHDGRQKDVTDQLPYGDFTPGRWAWLLDAIKPAVRPVPAKGHQQLWTWTVTP